ncbi:MAG: 50S ribosomal protein L24 [Oscillospiraceae bacterium]|jgi:large subunit ribosomal protein L24|nr:50S ribosomal protein L24 [Oscillospiraceae bacterium]
MNSLSVRKDDIVIVLSGKDKGRKGKVLHTYPKENKVLIEGINVSKRHTKPRKRNDPGGIVEKECPIYAPKVMRVCPKCQKPTRGAFYVAEDGTKSRVCKKCGDTI